MININELNATLRFGYVTEFDPARHMARVRFPDMALTSHWLPVMVTNSLRNHDETPLDTGEHVACLMQGQGSECGVILGSLYDDTNLPPNADRNTRCVTFSDGTRISYDRGTHELTVDSAEVITLRAGRIILDGNVDCPGYCRC